VCLSSLNDTLWTSADGFSAGHATGLQRASSAQGRQIVSTAGRFFIVGRIGFDNDNCACVSTVNGSVMSAPSPVLVRDVMGIAASDPTAAGGLTPIPDAPGYYIDPETGHIVGPPGTTIDPCSPTL